MAYERLYPFMDDRIEIMLAQLIVYFVAANSSKGSKPKPSDFMFAKIFKDKTDADSGIEDKIRATFSLFPKTSD